MTIREDFKAILNAFIGMSITNYNIESLLEALEDLFSVAGYGVVEFIAVVEGESITIQAANKGTEIIMDTVLGRGVVKHSPRLIERINY